VNDRKRKTEGRVCSGWSNHINKKDNKQDLTYETPILSYPMRQCNHRGGWFSVLLASASKKKLELGRVVNVGLAVGLLA
jgi:hypothetical protein